MLLIYDILYFLILMLILFYFLPFYLSIHLHPSFILLHLISSSLYQLMILICFYFSFFTRLKKRQGLFITSLIWIFTSIYSFHMLFCFFSKHVIIWKRVSFFWFSWRPIKFINQLKEPINLQSSFLTFQVKDLIIFQVLKVFPKYQDRQSQRYFYHYKFMERYHISNFLE